MEYYAAWDLALAQQESASAFAESEQPDDEDRQTLTDENLRLFLCEKLGKQKKPLPQPVKKKQPPSEKTNLDEMETPTEDEMEKGLQEAGPETSLQDEGGSPYADVQPHGNEESEESPPWKKTKVMFVRPTPKFTARPVKQEDNTDQYEIKEEPDYEPEVKEELDYDDTLDQRLQDAVRHHQYEQQKQQAWAEQQAMAQQAMARQHEALMAQQMMQQHQALQHQQQMQQHQQMQPQMHQPVQHQQQMQQHQQMQPQMHQPVQHQQQMQQRQQMQPQMHQPVQQQQMQQHQQMQPLQMPQPQMQQHQPLLHQQQMQQHHPQMMQQYPQQMQHQVMPPTQMQQHQHQMQQHHPQTQQHWQEPWDDRDDWVQSVHPNGKEVPYWWPHGDEAWFSLSKRDRWKFIHGKDKQPSHKFW